MAISANHWSHVLTIPEAFIPSAVTVGQTLVVNEGVIAKLPAAFQDIFWNAVQNGGGDVRICENQDGTGQLPVEVVSLDNAERTCVIWTRKNTYSGDGNLHFFVGKDGETQPPVTDPFGRNAVWQDYEAVNHGRDYTNATGKGDFSVFNAAPSSNPIKIGGGFDFTGVSGGLVANTTVSPNSPPVTLQAWFLTAFNFNPIFPVSVAGGGGYDYSISAYNSGTGDGANAQYPQNNSFGQSIAGRNPQKWKIPTFASLTVSPDNLGSLFYKNPDFEYSDQRTLAVQNPYALERVGIGYRADSSPSYGDGVSTEIRVKFGVIPESQVLTDYNNQSDPASFFGVPVLEKTGGSEPEPEPEPEIHEFSGGVSVGAFVTSSASKSVAVDGGARVDAFTQSSFSKGVEVNGSIAISAMMQSDFSKYSALSGDTTLTASTKGSVRKIVTLAGSAAVEASSIAFFEKVVPLSGTTSVDLTTQSDFSKYAELSGQLNVAATVSGTLFDENTEIHTFSGGITISANTSGQAIKVGLVSGESRVNAISNAQAQKVASISGEVKVKASTQSAFSKLASLAGNAKARVTSAAIITKNVILNGAFTVFARVSGTSFNTDTNVETYELTIQGRVKAPIVVQGSVKSITIIGRVK